MPSNSFGDNAVTVHFDVGGYDAKLYVIQFEGEETISRPYSFNISLASRDNALPFEQLVDAPGLLTIDSPSSRRMVHGVIRRFTQLDSGRKYTVYHANLVPRIHRLLHRTDCRIFQKQNIRSIIDTVLSGGGITHTFRSKGNISPAEREFCVQYRESDWDFVSRLLEDEGYCCWFEHKEDDHVLHIGNDPILHPDLPGNNLLPFAASGSTSVSQEHVFRFHYGEGIRSGKVTLADYNYEKPTTGLGTQVSSQHHDDLEIYDYPGLYQDKKGGEVQANVRLEQAGAERRRGQGESNCAGMAPGHTFSLNGHARHDFNRVPFLLTAVEHFGRKENVNLDSGALDHRLTYDNRFRFIPREVPYRPPRHTPRPMIRGAQTAVVVGPKNEEIYTDTFGRVKVHFHWDRLGKGDENDSCWVRVSQNWAGGRWGSVAIPRIGQEVIVEFLEGDPDRPIITGRVYHGQNLPPYSLPKHKTRTGIKSRSTKDGDGSNEIRFEDKQGAEEFFTHAERDHKEVVKNNMATEVGANRSVSVKKARSLSVGGSDSVSVGGSRSETVQKNHSVTVMGGRTVKVKQNETTTVVGQQRINSLQAMVLESNQAILLKVGGSTILIDGSGVKIDGTMVKLNCDGPAAGGSPDEVKGSAGGGAGGGGGGSFGGGGLAAGAPVSRAKPNKLPKTKAPPRPKTGISEQDYQAVADDLGVDVASVKAVAQVEAGGAGFLPSGDPKILFEAHVFSSQTGGKFDTSHPKISSTKWDKSLYRGGQVEHTRLAEAMKLDRSAALKSASWGRFQIMGFNHKAAGYETVEEYVAAMKQDEGKQLKAFGSFIKSNPAMHKALKNKDWAGFAKRYNGSGYKKNNYDTKISNAYNKLAK